MDHVTAGGIFVTKQESVYFRALIYKRSNVFPHIDKKFLTNGLMVLRDSTGKSQKNPGRVFVNMDDIHSLFVEINVCLLLEINLCRTISPSRRSTLRRSSSRSRSS